MGIDEYEIEEQCQNHIETHDVDVGPPFYKPNTKLTIMCPRCVNHSGIIRRPFTPEEIDEWLENMHNYVYILKSGAKVVKK